METFLGSLIIFFCIFLLGSCVTSENPIINFCSRSEREPSQCSHASDSKFDFGNINQSVLNFNAAVTGASTRLFIRCQAPYPIRWITRNYTGRIRQISTGESIRRNQTPLVIPGTLTFYQDIWISDGGRGDSARRMSGTNRILRCESFSNSSQASELYINRLGTTQSMDFFGSDKDINYYVVDINGIRTQGSFLVPCASKKHPISVDDVNLVETDRETGMISGSVSDDCIECICYAINGACVSRPCQTCGEIQLAYWRDANHNYNYDTSYEDCIKNSTCNRQTISRYMKRFTTDCNKDGIITCSDYMNIHYNGPGCGIIDVYTDKKFRDCLNNDRQNSTKLFGPADISYDPRIGFRVNGMPNFNSIYTCSPKGGGSSGYVTFAPLSSNLEASTSLIYRRAHDDLCCHTDPLGSMRGTHLVFIFCANITDCDLKFRSTTNLNPMQLINVVNTNSPQPRDGMLAENNSVLRLGVMDVNHGLVECSGILLDRPSQQEGSGFIKKIDYMFTGLDKNKYLISDWFPEGAVITVRKENGLSSEDARHEFKCKLSSFVLLPSVRFGIEFLNGTRILIASSSDRGSFGRATVQQLAVTGDGDSALAMMEWQMLITLKPTVKKVLCFAPWINSSHWAESEIPVTIEPVGKSLGAILAYCFATISILAVIVILVVWYKYKKAKLQMRTLTEEEINEFHKGNPAERKASDGAVNVECLAFNDKMKIPSDNLQTDTEVLGEGEFGIVYKGTYRDRVVAVKMTKSNADIDYFKAFLKEIKVMAYIGEHANIVKFYGAVVDDIKTRICLAVIELSPYGSLHDFLRENSSGFSNTFTTATGNDGSLNENATKADPSYENTVKVKFNLMDLVSICRQVASGMEFMCSKKVIHGDLATRNVLVFENNVVKITDFGLSRKLYGCANYVKKQTAPLPWRWMSIETLRYLSFSSKSDVWSFGVTLWEIFTLAQVPFSGLTWTVEFVDELESGLRLQKPNYAPQAIYEQMRKCWENNPDHRPSFTELKIFFKRFMEQNRANEGNDGDSSLLPLNRSHLHPLS